MISRACLYLGLLVLSAAAWAEPAAWRVASQATGGEILLLGSVHFLREADYPLPAKIDALYRQADALVLELGPEDLDPLRIQNALIAAALLPPGTLLSEVLDESLYRRLAGRARGLGLDPALIQGFKPWMVALTLMELGQSRHGYRPDLGVEQHLLGRARTDGLEVSGLESLETQLAVFDRLSDADQQALLEQTLQELDAIGETMDALVDAWREGRLDELAEELLGEFRDYPELYDALVTERNTAWIEVLENLLDDGRRYLVVVGALHLVGPNNVVELLEARGWRAAAE
jgi:uncharacterized protein